MSILRRALTIAVFAAALVAGWRFAAMNGEPVSVQYFFGEVEGTPMWGVLLGAFGAGFVVAAVLLLFQLAKLGIVARRQRREIGRLEAEIHELRNLPLASEPPAAQLADAEDVRPAAARSRAAGRGA